MLDYVIETTIGVVYLSKMRYSIQRRGVVQVVCNTVGLVCDTFEEVSNAIGRL